jgi:hypothetical protein
MSVMQERAIRARVHMIKLTRERALRLGASERGEVRGRARVAKCDSEVARARHWQLVFHPNNKKSSSA